MVGLQVATFSDLERRLGMPITPPPDPGAAILRVRHCARLDPGGAWVAEADGQLVGAALGIVREGLWGLSLLVVRPGFQSSGIGGELLRASLAHGDGARGGIILSSEDQRALRAYARAGFALRPVVDAFGPVRRRPPENGAVRTGRWPADRPLLDEVSRFVRGAAHGEDIGPLLASGAQLLVHDGGGFALHRPEGTVKLLAAVEDRIAQSLLRTAFARIPEGGEARAEFIAADQDWAVEVALDAGLALRPSGAIFVRGEVGPMRPYLPSGSYL